ncbi:MAG: hypothetical protein WA103_03075 [Minisyncoccales bacterium]
MWKQPGSIPYKAGSVQCLKIVRDIKSQVVVSEKTVNLPTISGVMICEECLADSQGLDPEKIKKNLLENQWTADDAWAAAEAITCYKKEHAPQI